MYADGNEYLQNHNKPVIQDIDTIDVDLSDFEEEQEKKRNRKRKWKTLFLRTA